ncbi:PIN-like domain-containing protein [Streptomyces bobili]|uniref:PIN-like domain-containing protein n=1 Tax=Streptomyces bobili TaxID=67280 RepID=A0ABZ1R0D2_9ACTN|nr:PIN-like domain-containing protein [Streptomyces bobili]
MRAAFSEYYSPTDDEYQAILTAGTIVLDANVLLAPYKLGADARKQTFSILESLRDRLWIPYQAAWEFFENRPNVIAGEDKVYQGLLKPLTDAITKIESHFDTLNGHPVVTDEERVKIMRHIEDAVSSVHRLSGGRDGRLEDALQVDLVLQQWEGILAGRLGEQPSDEVRVEREKIAEQRYLNKIPPGYLDSEKEFNKYGDALLWMDLMEKVRAAPGPVLMITNDVKEDWYRRQSGRTIGPRVELVREMATVGGQYYQQRLAAFLQRAARVVDKNVSEESLEAISRTSEGVERTLLNRLVHEISLIESDVTISQPIPNNGPAPDLIVTTHQGIVGIEFKNYASKITSRDIDYVEQMFSNYPMDGFLLVSSGAVSPVATRTVVQAAGRKRIAARVVEINDFHSPDAIAQSFLSLLNQMRGHGINKNWRY